MFITRRWTVRGTAALGMLAVFSTGCQTYPAGFGGMTLPSPQYLKHYPQYFTPDQEFPLQRELDSQQDPEGQLRRGVGGVAPGALQNPPGDLPQPVPAK